ncbi:hypothetical protein SEA_PAULODIABOLI_311 [Microbacterium phage PauloDiaboli]|nr:hypothetical protein SEA_PAULODIABOLI_311 [Microbacterium phage PauloDiaboli]
MTKTFSTKHATTHGDYHAEGQPDGTIHLWKTGTASHIKVGRDATLSRAEASVVGLVVQDQRDIDLGRFRSQKAPHYVVYPDRDAKKAENWGTLLDERNGDSVYINRKAVMADPVMEDVRKEYFATIPVRGPWEDANHGDVWLLTRSESKEAYTMDRREPEIYPAGVWRNLDTYMAGNSDDIKSGKPIYTAENN